MRQTSKSLLIGSVCALALAQRHTMEQKALQETQEPKPAGKHEEPHG
jgi:hypothetical protein